MVRTKVRDPIIASAAVVIALLAAIHFDVFEGFASWAQRYEGWQVDALLILPVFLATVLAFLFWRRYEELHRQRDLYEDVLTAQSELGEGLIVIEDGRIGYANEAFCEMSGYGQEELTALPS